mmetsp:Transcript_34689/g.73922  ORF Transcript_34689/g.73922 Transcript_34689/m.73922 type:complete len:200 (-) Transcript_34689:680-1279(-)
MMSIKASGWSSRACVNDVFMVAKRGGAVLPKGIPREAAVSPSEGATRSFTCACRRASLAFSGAERAPSLGRGGPTSSASRSPPPVRVVCAKRLHSVVSLAIHAAASWRTDLSGMGMEASFSPPGLTGANGGSMGRSPPARPCPAVKPIRSVSLRAALAPPSSAEGDFVSFCDFRRTESQFFPSVTERGWSSPKQRFATW